RRAAAVVDDQAGQPGEGERVDHALDLVAVVVVGDQDAGPHASSGPAAASCARPLACTPRSPWRRKRNTGSPGERRSSSVTRRGGRSGSGDLSAPIPARPGGPPSPPAPPAATPPPRPTPPATPNP